jgi:hypothetical protein
MLMDRVKLKVVVGVHVPSLTGDLNRPAPVMRLIFELGFVRQ